MKRPPAFIQRKRDYKGRLRFVAVGHYWPEHPIEVWLKCGRTMRPGRFIFDAVYGHPLIDSNYACTAWKCEPHAVRVMLGCLEPTVYFEPIAAPTPLTTAQHNAFPKGRW